VGAGLAMTEVFGVCDSRDTEEDVRNRPRDAGGRSMSEAGAGGGLTHVRIAECA